MKKRLIIIGVAGVVAIGALLIPTASQADSVSDAAAVCAARHQPLCDSLFGPGGSALTPAQRAELADAILREDSALNTPGVTTDDLILRDVFSNIIQRFPGTGPFDQLIRDALRGAFLEACNADGDACEVSF